MKSIIDLHHLLFFSLFATLLILMSGCAQKQWQQPVDESREKAVRLSLEKEIEYQKSCSTCIDTEITASWQSQIGDGAIQGYFQIFMPSSFKLVAINPLGQPLFAFATNGTRFQTINAQKGVFKYGKISTFVDKHDLPKHLLDGDWPNWVAGRLPTDSEQIIEIRQDELQRGVWLKVEKDQKTDGTYEYLLWDPISKRLFERVILEKDNDRVATFFYHQWNTANRCPFPTQLDIDGGSFSADINVSLDEIITDKQFDEDTFYLKLPPNYLQQFYP